MTDLLKVQGLSLRSDSGRVLLDDISFCLGGGEVIGVLGPNGAGKTSLLRCIFGAATEYQGDILLNGFNLRQLSHRQRALKIAAVTQESPADFQLSVAAVIATGRTPHQHWLTGKDPQASEVIERCIRQFRLEEYLQRDIAELSGGERKRVMICRALVQQPDLLVLDEPCNHLDIVHQISLMQQLRDLPVSCLVSLHDFPMAARYCDRLLIMQNGRLEKLGSSAEVLTSELFSKVFSVSAQPYTNPWEQWAYCVRAPETGVNQDKHSSIV